MKNQYNKIQIYLNNTIIIIYINDSSIKNKIDAMIYNASMNKTSHQYLENEVQYIYSKTQNHISSNQIIKKS